MSDVTDLRLDELRASLAIVDEQGRPTPAFIRKWEQLVGDVTFTSAADRQERVNQASQIIRVEQRERERPDILWVSSANDLAPYLSGDVYTLPDKLVVPVNTVDLGDKALAVSTGTVINGLSKGVFVSSNASGVLRAASSVASAVVVHNVSFVATAGPVLALEGPTDQQLNLDFVGLFGPSAGTITGYDVSSVKSCFIEAGDGITYAGTTNKIFVVGSPFYAITGAALRFDSALTCKVAHIESSFFKFDAPGIGIEAQTGYTVDRGLLITSLKEGTLTLLSGFGPGDVQWDIRDNQGVRNSAKIGALAQDHGEETTVIAAVDTPVKANLTTSPSSLNERFSHTNNRLTYTGLDPVTVLLTAAASMGSAANNQEIRLRLAKDGTPLDTARTKALLRGGGDVDPVSVSGIARLETGEYVEIFVENLTSDGDITMEDADMSVAQSA